MQPNNSLDKGKDSGCLGHKDEYELEFEVRQGSVQGLEDGRHVRRVERMSAQAAYETNSSLGSENCSLDSIQVGGLEMPMQAVSS